MVYAIRVEKFLHLCVLECGFCSSRVVRLDLSIPESRKPAIHTNSNIAYSDASLNEWPETRQVTEWRLEHKYYLQRWQPNRGYIEGSYMLKQLNFVFGVVDAILSWKKAKITSNTNNFA